MKGDTGGGHMAATRCSPDVREREPNHREMTKEASAIGAGEPDIKNKSACFRNKLCGSNPKEDEDAQDHQKQNMIPKTLDTSKSDHDMEAVGVLHEPRMDGRVVSLVNLQRQRLKVLKNNAAGRTPPLKGGQSKMRPTWNERVDDWVDVKENSSLNSEKVFQMCGRTFQQMTQFDCLLLRLHDHHPSGI